MIIGPCSSLHYHSGAAAEILHRISTPSPQIQHSGKGQAALSLRPVPSLLCPMTCMGSLDKHSGSEEQGRKPRSFLNRNTSLLRETEARAAGRNVVDNVLALEEDVTEDVEANALIGLDATEAGAAAARDGCVVNKLARHGLGDAADGDGKVGQGGTAGEHVAALCVIDFGAANLGVVCLCDCGVDVDQGCAGVNDTGDVGLDGSRGADGVASCGEAPEALAGVDVDVGDGSSVLR